MAKDKAITSQTRERNGLRGRCRLLRRDGRKIGSLLGRVNHQRAAASIVGQIKRRVGVVSEKRKVRRMILGIDHGQHAAGCVPGKGHRRSRSVGDILQINLVGVGCRTVAGQTDERPGELRRVVEHQVAGRGLEGDRPGTGIGQFEGGAGVDRGRLRHVAQVQYDLSGDFENGRCSIDYAIAVEILVEGGFNRFERRAGPGYVGQQVRYEVAVAISAPHRARR